MDDREGPLPSSIEKGSFDSTIRKCRGIGELSNHIMESEEEISSFSGNLVKGAYTSG